jgi:hypothetical protein
MALVLLIAIALLQRALKPSFRWPRHDDAPVPLNLSLSQPPDAPSLGI